MNRIPTPGLLFAALCSAAACEATVTPATDAAAPMDAPRDAPADVSAGPDTAALPDIPAALPDIPAASPDVRPLRGAGTCASPIDLNAEGTAEGSDLVYRGTTAGMGDVLHPYEGCVARDTCGVVGCECGIPCGS